MLPRLLAVLSLCFNPRQRKLLAAGDASGRVNVWRLGWRLSNEQPNEAGQLKRFVVSNDTGGAAE